MYFSRPHACYMFHQSRIYWFDPSNNKTYEAPHYAILSIILLRHLS